MSKIVRFRKMLVAPPTPVAVEGICVRMFQNDADVTAWLELRCDAFAGVIAAGHAWTSADFDRQFRAKHWWSAERMWLAVTDTDHIVGSVVLGQSGRQDERALVGWLMVAPTFRRRGIGRLLLAMLEAAAWSQEKRELTLETHADWTAAMRLYEACGYERAH